MKDFKNKVAAITGAASGMGRTLAVELAKRGCHLALSDVNETELVKTAELAGRHGVKVTITRLDVADKEAVYAWADQVARDHGKVNLIFNNAGVALTAPLEHVKHSDFEWIVGINFWGVVYGTQAFLPHLKASGEGHVINTSSLFGLMAVPTQGCYNATKFAVRGFTESLRQELDMADCGVSASCVHPGGIKTNIAKTARMNDSLSKVTGQDADKARQQFNDQLLRTTPEKAAQVIINGVLANKRRILIGPDAFALDGMQRLWPAFYQRLVTASMRLAARFAPKGSSKKVQAAVE